MRQMNKELKGWFTKEIQTNKSMKRLNLSSHLKNTYWKKHLIIKLEILNYYKIHSASTVYLIKTDKTPGFPEDCAGTDATTDTATEADAPARTATAQNKDKRHWESIQCLNAVFWRMVDNREKSSWCSRRKR